MSNKPDSTDDRRLQLSALMDGELRSDSASGACALFRHDAQARRSWHAWHLAGDVLRSDELATRPAHDEAFLQALRLKLAAEPVPLAPGLPAAPPPVAWPQAANGAAAVPARSRRVRQWFMAPVAVAAGFVAVAGVMVVTRVMAPDVAGPTLASAPAVPMVSAGPAQASAVLVRDAQLDRYLSAHRTLANGGMPASGTEHRVHIVFEGQ